MLSLHDICDLPIQYDDFEDEVRIPIENICCQKRTINLSSMSPTLLNKSISYPEKVYEEYSISVDEKVEEDKDLKYDILVLPSGLLGIEFIKSHVFYTPNVKEDEQLKFATIVEGINGITTIIMQKNAFGIGSCRKPRVKEGVMMEIKPREKVAIPSGYYYTFINTRDKCAVVSRVYKSYDLLDYKELKTKGLAYFCIRKNAKQELVYNPMFDHIPSIKKTTPEENHLPTLGFNLEESLYNLVKSNTEILLNILA
ncbi:hypothetical protein GF362_04330 [Candidatus Dojkabacteria bacterium]|nr:hypothetical protein [Candidatus Dojkabacteria bacterium]